MNPIMVIVLFGMVALILLVVILIVTSVLAYNIPVTILRFVGGRGRPTIIHTKAKKWVRKGVSRLKVRGYKLAIRDFKAEFYYPATKTKHGGLILWEFEDGMLTPAIPHKVPLSPEKKKVFTQVLGVLQEFQSVGFEFDNKLHEQLKLKAVDDVDIDFMLQEYARIDQQYYGGLMDFLNKYGSHVTLVVVALILLVALVLFFQKAPDIAAQCANAAIEQGDNLVKQFAERITEAPPG